MNIRKKKKKWLESLYESTNRQLFYTALGILHDEQEAEEVVHDLYVKWLERASYYEKKQEKEMLSLGIISVKHACYNRLDYRKKHPETVYEDEEELLGEGEDSLLTILEREKTSEVTKALEQLSDAEKSVILLRYYHNMPYQKIANELEIKKKTVEVRLRRAKQHLREVMEHESYEFRT